MKTSKILSGAAIGLLSSAAILTAAPNMLPSNQQQQKNKIEQTSNPMKDYGIPIATGLLGIGVGAGAIVKRRQERIQEEAQAELAAQNEKLINEKAKQKRILNEKFSSHYGLNYTGEMKQTPDSVTKRDLRNYVERMEVILNTEPKNNYYDKSSGKYLLSDKHAAILAQKAKDLTKLYMENVKEHGCEDYLSEDFRFLNTMSNCFNYSLTANPFDFNCDSFSYLNAVKSLLSINAEQKDFTALVNKAETDALKDLSEKIYSDADKSTSNDVLSKSEVMTLIKKELGLLSSLIDVDRLSNMMVLNAYKERDVLNRLAHTLAVTPWYELSGESFQ